MTCSAARLAANRANALLSTGPKTEEGKAVSRANSLKHGLTGAGVVVPDEDEGAIRERFERLQAEMNPRSELARILVQRVAMLSIRLERAAREEAGRLSVAIRNAGAAFDDARQTRVERLADWIAASPATNARRLRQMPEGVDWMIRTWRELQEDLGNPHIPWSAEHTQRAENLTGRRPSEFRVSRISALSMATRGDFTFLEAAEGGDLDTQDRQVWARSRLAELIDAEVARLQGLREQLDPATVALDRAEAPRLALLDRTAEGQLARKYEAAAERGMYKAIRQFDQVQAGGELPPEPEGPLGSFSPGVEADELATLVARELAIQPPIPRNPRPVIRPGHPLSKRSKR